MPGLDQMNEASRKRLQWARSLATVYASHPDVSAIILGGSTARNSAHEHSDIDLGVFWTKVAPQDQRRDLMRRIGGQLERSVDNRQRYSIDNPRRQGCVEIIDLTLTPDTPHLKLDVEHETVAGTETVLFDVIEQHDPSLEKQELLSVLHTGIALYGIEMIGRWQEKANDYPAELAHKMIDSNFSRISDRVAAQLDWLKHEEWFCLYEGFLDIGRRLILTLFGLNKTWAFTDNPNFKGLRPFVGTRVFKPPDFFSRLGAVLQSEPLSGIQRSVELCEDVAELITIHMPHVKTGDEIRKLRQIKDRATRSS